jgi:hypothetical protein
MTLPRPTSWCSAAIAQIGAALIYLMIRVFGRTVEQLDPWLDGPVGGDIIGDRPYEECAKAEGLDLERDANAGGLLSDFGALESPSFDVARVAPEVRHFYEHTALYRMDMWSKASFPASVALWLLVTFISRRVNQLNFPIDVIEAAKGMGSEIVLLRDSAGRVRYAGWYRRLLVSDRAVYTGFYMSERLPSSGRTCVKVVFPMPRGNATVILEPRLDEHGDFVLTTEGGEYGGPGFYRVHHLGGNRWKVWRIESLKEHFKLYVDGDGVLRCDHHIRFLGLPVLHLHYRIERRSRSNAQDIVSEAIASR